MDEVGGRRLEGHGQGKAGAALVNGHKGAQHFVGADVPWGEQGMALAAAETMGHRPRPQPRLAPGILTAISVLPLASSFQTAPARFQPTF